MSARPHRLLLYRAAVQNPVAEITLLLRILEHGGGAAPRVFREDFAGGAALAALWAMMEPGHRAIAVESDAATVRWACKRLALDLAERAGQVTLLHDDVLACRRKADIIAALNFSVFIWHSRDALVRYFRHCRACLNPGGMVAVDAFGGPGAMRRSVQRRPVPRALVDDLPAFTYQWEQRGHDPVRGRIDCRIHFRLGRQGVMRDAFVYDWRLWSPAELVEAMQAAGLANVTVWGEAEPGSGLMTPVQRMEPREDYVVCVAGFRT